MAYTAQPTRSQPYYNQPDAYYHPTSVGTNRSTVVGVSTTAPITATATLTTTTTVASSTTRRYIKMAVVPGRQTRAILDIFAFILCIAFVAVQFALIDYYYLTVTSDNIWYAWIAADVLVIVILIWITALAVRTNQQEMEEICTADSKIKYAWVGWLAYSIVLVAKLATCFRSFYKDVLPNAADNNDKLFDDNLFRLGIALSAFVFLFLLESHHYTPVLSQRQLYVTYLATAVCIDIVDTVYFIDLLWEAIKHNWNLELWLEITILALASINLVLPAFALLKLRFGRFPKYALVSEKIWSLIYVLVANAPYLGIRIYLYVLLKVQHSGAGGKHHYDLSLFVVKNLLLIYLAVREVWNRLQHWRAKRGAQTGSRGELTAATTHDDEH